MNTEQNAPDNDGASAETRARIENAYEVRFTDDGEPHYVFAATIAGAVKNARAAVAQTEQLSVRKLSAREVTTLTDKLR